MEDNKMGQNRDRRMRTGKMSVGKRTRVRKIEEENARLRFINECKLLRIKKGRENKKPDPSMEIVSVSERIAHGHHVI